MKILAVEFSSGQRSVALVEEQRVLGEAHEVATRATPAFGLIHAVLAQAGVEREAVECLAIGLGPGSYTGIRSAIALAQGWQLAAGVKLLGISSVAGLAEEARGRGWTGRVNLVIDAQRNEVYLAGWEINADACREVEPLRLATMEQAALRAAAGEIVAGPDAARWFGAGRELVPGAATLGRIAASRSDYLPGEALVPIYLRETTFVKAPPPRIIPAG